MGLDMVNADTLTRPIRLNVSSLSSPNYSLWFYMVKQYFSVSAGSVVATPTPFVGVVIVPILHEDYAWN